MVTIGISLVAIPAEKVILVRQLCVNTDISCIF